ncbi:MAG: type I restriction endonuclease subunit R [Fimbriimonadaceae bacterium]
MSEVGKIERITQNRVVALFRDELGYEYLGNWEEREGNSNVEEHLLTSFLAESGYSTDQISRALDKLRREATNPSRTLYANNQEVWNLLYYGVDVKVGVGDKTEKVRLVNWDQPEKNHFGIAEEVTLNGDHERRPDIAIYLNGLALGVLELKRSTVGIGEGIRQAISNQDKLFHEWFYPTVQFVMAGNDSEGLQYGSIGTPEKMWLKWKEGEADNTRFKLDKYLLKLFEKRRFLDLVRNFVVFDAGVKKLPRPHQYFGVKLAQDRIKEKQGGIIWHTQGSGKSIVMVLLAKWILEHNPNARVCLITDRDELDKQIKDVFEGAGQDIYRTSSGADLMSQLSQATPRLLCSLVHKFGHKGVGNFDAFIEEIKSKPSRVQGEIFVFVDEAHRTQSGKLNKAMKALLPGSIFIGFTGTPLLRQDKQTTMEVFGRYIHTYKFKEAVEDKVVLDLIYEARDIDQHVGNQEKIDLWFEAKTRGLNEWQREELKNKWGTMQSVLSSKARMDRVVSDIVFDFSIQPRLSSARGNAMLVASSIYEACKYFELFQKTVFRNHCAIITSYDPQVRDVTLEDTGANTETDKQYIYNIYTELLKKVDPAPGKSKTETYEDAMKERFKKEPASMKLLIVVNKLLTGFDAPPCTYLYIDKSLQDHGLFQAICRTNRLDGDDKDFGHIVDYKDLFKKVENAISVYTSELDDSTEGAEPEVLIKDRLEIGRQRLDSALEALHVLCEPVELPRGELEHIHYFCGNTEIPTDLEDREVQRITLYKLTVALVRAYANIADELSEAGYSEQRITDIKERLDHYVKLRDVIRQAAGEVLDIKPFEADMRHLIDTYIQSDEPRKISPFDDMPLLELIVKTGIAAAIESLPEGLRENQEAIAETIENNVRSKIVKEQINDPAFFAKMSALLVEIIAARKDKALKYEDYLKKIAALAKMVEEGASPDMPQTLNSRGKRALYNNLGQDEDLALRLDAAVRKVRPDGWRGNAQKEKVIKRELYGILKDDDEVERVFAIVRQQMEY